MSRIQGFLIDIDGVLYVGDRPVDGAGDALRILKENGYTYRFVSNTTRKCRRTIARRLQTMGLEVPEALIFTPPVAAVALMKKTGKAQVRLLVTGDVGADFPRDCQVCGSTVPDYVIVGDAGEMFTYENLNRAFRDLTRGADLIALEKDRFWMADDGLSLSAGPFVSALEYATGKSATLMGKPSGEFFAMALQDMHLSPNNVVMIGDDIQTDVGGAQSAGMRGVLVRTGKFREEYLTKSGIRPDRVIDSIADIQQIIDRDLGLNTGMRD